MVTTCPHCGEDQLYPDTYTVLRSKIVKCTSCDFKFDILINEDKEITPTQVMQGGLV